MLSPQVAQGSYPKNTPIEPPSAASDSLLGQRCWSCNKHKGDARSWGAAVFSPSAMPCCEPPRMGQLPITENLKMVGEQLHPTTEEPLAVLGSCLAKR